MIFDIEKVSLPSFILTNNQHLSTVSHRMTAQWALVAKRKNTAII